MQNQNNQNNNESYFGVCPICKKSNGYVNIHQSHWSYCKEHKICWCIGYNLFSSWHNENESIWLSNAKMLEDYKILE